MRRGWVLALTAVMAACLPSRTLVQSDDAGTPPPTDFGDGDAGQKLDVDLGDPFAILGLAPSHGPFTGGTRSVISGRGFSSGLRVFVAGVEIDPSAVFASDPTRAAVTMPPGKPGPVDVMVRDDKTAKERVLPAGFTYDAIHLVPETGSTTGGTRVAIEGSGTSWADGTAVTIDGKPCADVQVVDATHLLCTTGADSPGSKDVLVTAQDKSTVSARDAFTYGDSADGYRGGLSGGALSGQIKVLALDAWTGMAIPGATAIVGSDAQTALVKTTDGSGAAIVKDGSLTGAVTVTIAEKCHQPMTFVDVPVDTVTAYLSPLLDVSCANGDPQSISGQPRSVGLVSGQLVFPIGGEIQAKGDWTGVPLPSGPNQRRAAYVFVATTNPQNAYVQPDPKTATTMDSAGDHGYAYSLTYYPGNQNLYALAGIEDTSVQPSRFSPFVMGVVKGVPIIPNDQTTQVDVLMNIPMDHEVQVAPAPPASTTRGPDRMLSLLSTSVGQGTYALLPTGRRTDFLPHPGAVSFVGVPPLVGALTGESYVLGVQAATGPYLSYPASVISGVKTNDANVPVALTGFLPVPTPLSPGQGQWDGTSVDVTASGPIDLVEVQISSGGGLSVWTVVSPGKLSFKVPDLSQIAPGLGPQHGTIQTTAYVASINGFQYAQLRSGQLYSGAWSAYAFDSYHGAY